jgi:uracil phosphoribosyltransferase
VTVTAEVEVKRASKKFVTVPVLDAAGNMSKKVPRRIRAVKAVAINCVEDSLGSFGISDKSILLSAIDARGCHH